MARSNAWFLKVSEAGATKGRQIATFGTERTCARDDCRTPLSRYNPEELCSLHSEGAPEGF